MPKDHPQVQAVGALDELNVEVGGARLACMDTEARGFLRAVQACLVAVMGEVACAEEDAERHLSSGLAVLREPDLALLDARVKAIEATSVRFDGWATPGATAESLALERARVTARRAERCLAALPGAGRHLRPLVLQWVNRLSDVFWLMARACETARPGG